MRLPRRESGFFLFYSAAAGLRATRGLKKLSGFTRTESSPPTSRRLAPPGLSSGSGVCGGRVHRRAAPAGGNRGRIQARLRAGRHTRPSSRSSLPLCFFLRPAVDLETLRFGRGAFEADELRQVGSTSAAWQDRPGLFSLGGSLVPADWLKTGRHQTPCWWRRGVGGRMHPGHGSPTHSPPSGARKLAC